MGGAPRATATPGIVVFTHERSAVFVHIVSFNSAQFLEPCIRSVLAQEGFRLGDNLFLRVTDNASRDASLAVLKEKFAENIQTHANSANLGFCGGHNQGARAFLDSSAALFLILNPDIRLERNALKKLAEALSFDQRAGMCCARLMRSDAHLEPVFPAVPS